MTEVSAVSHSPCSFIRHSAIKSQARCVALYCTAEVERSKRRGLRCVGGDVGGGGGGDVAG